MPYPLAIGAVTLTVHDLDRTAAFYEQVIGLHRLARDGETVSLGVGGVVLLRLNQDRAARRSSPREAGLFHTAFLLPGRADLARWLNHAAIVGGVRLQGVADHLVSEALYLADPEGNGIEIYADRPASEWRWHDGMVQMATEPLDLDALRDTVGAAAATHFPDGTIIGHVHLQVGDLKRAQEFYAGPLGMDVTSRSPGATFLSSGGYHHHLATNVWNSRGAALRQQPAMGLAEVELIATGPQAQRKGEKLTDPWGTHFVMK